MKKAGIAGFFHAREEELLLHFLSSSLGSIGSGADCITGSLRGFCSSIGCRGSSISGRSSSIGSRGGRSSSSVSSRGGRSSSGVSSRGGSRSSGFGGRSRCFFRLRAGSESKSKQGGGEEGRFHFDFLG